MQGALSSKCDLVGGIFDRWISTVHKSIIFNIVQKNHVVDHQLYFCIEH